MAMKKTMAILLSVLLMLFLAVPTFASSAFFSPASVLSRTLRFDLFSFLQWDMRMIRMPSVWDSGLTGQGVQVGIIDSGISAKNRDLDPDRILPGTQRLWDLRNRTGSDTCVHEDIGSQAF